MKRTIRTALAVSAAVGVCALAWAFPTAAQANAIYPPTGSCTVSPATATPGGTIILECADSTFSASETITVTVTGENGQDASIGMMKFAVSTASGTARSTQSGALESVRIVLPSNASGTYNIAAVSATSAGGTAAATVASADGALPVTGLDSASLTGLWIGGGALLLAGGTLAVVAVLRRSHRDL